MIRIEVSDPSGLTGSESIDGLYVYFSKDHFTVDSLPTPYKNNTPSYSGYSIDLPEKNTPYWIMWAYRGRDNQIVYSPIVSLIDWTPGATSLFNGRPGFVAGDAQFGQLASTITFSERVNTQSFGASNIPWETPAKTPTWFMDKGVITGAVTTNEALDTTIGDLYRAGYLGKSGDMSDQLTAGMITAMGGPVEQGRTFSTTNGNFKTWVPTITEFRTLIGSMFQTGIPTSKPAVSVNPLQEDVWYITSSEAQGGFFWGINASGTAKALSHNAKATVKMLYSLEFK